MSEKNYFTVIAYDVANDKRRRALVKVLESFGERAQESVFEAWLTERERKKMETKAHNCIDTAEDRLAIYVLPKIDREAIVSVGQGSIAQDFTHLIL
jgi:CRISPR-associated protein Cas2